MVVLLVTLRKVQKIFPIFGMSENTILQLSFMIISLNSIINFLRMVILVDFAQSQKI